MKKIYALLPLLMAALILGSCSNAKQVPYFQNIDTLDLSASKGLYDAKIMPKDELTIVVMTTNPDASGPFNLRISSNSSTTAERNIKGYLVDNDGNINFPVVGKIHVAGLTKTECEDVVKQKIAPYMAASENPVVIVRMSSFRVTVIGEVGSSKVVPVDQEKMSVIEALASAGDLGILGRRGNVLLVREDANGQKHAHRLNLNDAHIFESPYYYLQQNDIIYVEPNKQKAISASYGANTAMWISLVGFVSSMATLLVSIFK